MSRALSITEQNAKTKMDKNNVFQPQCFIY